MLKEKSIYYAIRIIKSASSGTDSILDISDEIGGSRTYVAKVVALLRKAELIDADYNVRDNITLRDVVQAIDNLQPTDDMDVERIAIMQKIVSKILESLDFPLSEVW
jgi:DNA-binding IscR family transcriptional regulator